MAQCLRCGNEYDEDTVEYEYDNNDYICDSNLEGTYGNFIGYCANCAADIAADSYPQGLEDMSYHIGD